VGICCEKCFDNEGLKEYIINYDEIADCQYCMSKNVYVINTEDIGEFIRSKLDEYYENVDDSDVFYDSDNEEDVFGVLNNIEVIFSEALYYMRNERMLFDDFMSDSGPGYSEIKDGEFDWLDGGNSLIVRKDERNGTDDNRFNMSWEQFKYQCKYYSRFFDIGLEDSRESLLKVVAELLTKSELTINLDKGDKVYRARILDDKFDIKAEPIEILKNVGPPQKDKVKNNRMSPAGIPYIYLSNAKEICFSEIRAKTNDSVVVAEFEITKRLKILDLTSVPNIKERSIFDDEFDPDIRWATDFMRRFNQEISRPISEKEAALEYVPTQLLAEFIRKIGFDGIQFKSSINKSGLNYTLFYGPIVEPNLDIYGITCKELQGFTDAMKLIRVDFYNVKNSFNLGSSRDFEENDFISIDTYELMNASQDEMEELLLTFS